MAGLAKPAARARGKAARAALSEAERADKSRRIVQSCREVLAWGSYRQVHLFLPIERLREVDTWPLLTWIWEAHPRTQTYVPRMNATDMEHVRVTSANVFAPNALGIPEPLSGGREEAMPEPELDLVLAPLLAYDAAGHRVGYGGGHYDRFLGRHPEARRVGLAFAELFVPEGIAAEGHDMRLHEVITEAGVATPSQ